MTGRIILFERLTRWHLPVVAWYHLRGDSIYYRSCAAGCEPARWGGAIAQFEGTPPLYRGVNGATDQAFDHIEALYARAYAQQGIIRLLRNLYGSDEIHLAFKKALLKELSEFYYCRLLAERIQRAHPQGRHIFLVPADLGQPERQRAWADVLPAAAMGETHLPPWSFPCWVRLAGLMRSLQERLVAAGILVRVLARAIRGLLRPSRQPSVHTYDVALTIVAWRRQLHDNLRSAGFLIDGRLITRDRVLLVPLIRLTRRQIAWLAGRALQVSPTPLRASRATCRQALGAALRLIGQLPRQAPWLLRTAAHLIEAFCIWRAFTERYRIGRFVTHADHGIGHIARNILLKQQGSAVWSYVDSGNLTYLHPHAEAAAPRYELWGFLYYDVMVCWNAAMVRYFQRHHQHVERYEIIGCLWSEHVRLLREGTLPMAVRQQLLTRGWRPGQPVVAWFPTWYQADNLTDHHDGLAFAQAIQQLLTELPDVFMVVKEKHQRWLFAKHPVYGGPEARRIYEAYEQLERHPRCWLPGPTANASEIVAASDLVISFPFTSVTVEAMAGRVKAIYYGPHGRYRGAHYDRIPGMVVHSGDELKHRVAQLLHETSADEYDRYLTQYAKGEVDPFLDGQALTRFRTLLAGAARDDTPEALPSALAEARGSS
ncbi:MAG: polysaccharide biosynthesis PFTS motif protein [Candidatus Omnitrophica bacterium]|nr:polysaccharide biosynthesis PFTS motif protein [Candidatus Omnitrophota bacterium]